MKDQLSIDRLKLLHPKVQDTFRKFVEEAETTLDVTMRISQGFRTITEQDALYAQGRTKPGSIITNAKGGSSYHNYGLAIDLVQMVQGGKAVNWNFDYSKLAPIAKKYGIEWGGNFKSLVDKPHFQITLGYSIKQLQDKQKAKDFIELPYLNL